MPNPRFAGRGAFRPPAFRQVSQFFQTAIPVNRMVETGNRRGLAARHAVTEELPSAVFSIVRNVGYRLFTRLHRDREEDGRVGRLRELPIKEAAAGVGGSPEVRFQLRRRPVRLQERLREADIEALIFGKAILEVGIDGLDYWLGGARSPRRRGAAACRPPSCPTTIDGEVLFM